MSAFDYLGIVVDLAEDAPALVKSLIDLKSKGFTTETELAVLNAVVKTVNDLKAQIPGNVTIAKVDSAVNEGATLIEDLLKVPSTGNATGNVLATKAAT
jgi:hypothetical protein